MDQKEFGKKGELKAAEFLEKKGFKIIETNYLKRVGEIDIIAFDPKWKEYVFVEVKSRRSLSFGYPEESVDEKKIQKISDTAENWFIEKNVKDPEWRIDIISIEWQNKIPKITHIQNIN